jgi:CDP-glycerol glycerophosphotransferase (TagB/SpsB family)
LGSPKFDAISHKEQLPLNEAIVKQSSGRRIVVWKMHFPKKIVENGKVYQITPYMDEYVEFARNIDRYSELYFVVMPHPKMLRGVVASDIQGDDTLMGKVSELFQILSGKNNVFIDKDDDYRKSLYHADAIIMDRSAVMIEAAMLDVPVLLMKNQDYSEPMTVPVENIVNCFIQGSRCRDMYLFVESVMRGEDTKAEARRNAIAVNMPYNDGMCGERIKNDIANGIIQEKTSQPRVVFYGTGEICRYYMEKQNWNHSEKFRTIAMVDSNPSKWGTDFYDINMMPPEKLLETEFDAIVIMTEPHYFEIKKNLVYDYYIDERKIWRLDEFVATLESL